MNGRKDKMADYLRSRSGDLRAKADPQDVLHSFSLGSSPFDRIHGSDRFRLPAKLDLGVGGDGVIGRRVSLVRRTGADGARVLRQGIIGWN